LAAWIAAISAVLASVFVFLLETKIFATMIQGSEVFDKTMER